MKLTTVTGLGMLLGLVVACSEDAQSEDPTSEVEQANHTLFDPARTVVTKSTTGTIDRTNPFFQSLGTNGRVCETCHVQGEGMSITPRGLRARFDATDGLDPVFRPHDGANAPLLDVSTVEARRAAYSLLLSRGVIRIGLPVKPTSEFELTAVDDPYGHASAAQLSLFRRPLPTTNLRFVATVNWDGRNTPDLTNMRPGLMNQSNGATVNHAQATAPIADDVRGRIVDFETSLVIAQSWNALAGPLDVLGATGGPTRLLEQTFTIGANDPTQPGFDPNVFKLYESWLGRSCSPVDWVRSAIADGERVFNTKTFAGARTCSGCHSAPNVGSHPTFRFFDVGISSAARRRSDVPLYTFTNKTTGETVQTTDPGRALISGQWADMNRFKVPVLRGLAARAPYFHDGSARSISEVVDHYEHQFGIDFRDDEKKHLVMFLESL